MCVDASRNRSLHTAYEKVDTEDTMGLQAVERSSLGSCIVTHRGNRGELLLDRADACRRPPHEPVVGGDWLQDADTHAGEHAGHCCLYGRVIAEQEYYWGSTCDGEQPAGGACFFMGLQGPSSQLRGLKEACQARNQTNRECHTSTCT
eukprot:1134940-Pelagomonas_calceolata.AAC.2